jgi:hypothetical protein
VLARVWVVPGRVRFVWARIRGDIGSYLDRIGSYWVVLDCVASYWRRIWFVRDRIGLYVACICSYLARFASYCFVLVGVGIEGSLVVLVPMWLIFGRIWLVLPRIASYWLVLGS